MGGSPIFERLCGFTSRHVPVLVSLSKRRMQKEEASRSGSTPTRFPSILEKVLGGRARDNAERPSKPGYAVRIVKELRFAAIPLSPEEVLAGAMFGAFLAGAVLMIAALIAFEIGGLGAAIYLLPLAVAGPPAVYSVLASYPELRAKKIRMKSLGSAPEAVTYMAMSLKLTPSLNRAVEFAAENTEEPLSSRLRGVLWDVYTRKRESVEESFMAFANEWGEWNEDLKRSLYGLLTAAGEGTQEGLDRAVERAQDMARTGARRRTEEFVVSLRMPTIAFFALCVLLPLIIGSTLPVLSLGGIGVPSADSVSSTSTGGGGVQVVVLLDIVFPLIALIYSVILLGKRPGTTGSLLLDRESDRKGRRRSLVASLALAAAPLPFLTQGTLAPIAALWCVVLGVSAYMLLGSVRRRRRRKEVRLLEQQMPDALFIVGSKLGEGLSVEQAMARASESLRGMEIASFLDNLRFSLQLHRRGLEETLFGREGLLMNCPSRMIRVSLKMVVDLSRKDPSAAGKALVDFSHYLRDLQELEKDIRARLGETVDAMKSTATFFAPMVLGITSALYLLLAKSFAGLAPLPLSPQSFIAALGVYLVAMVPVIVNFSVGLETGGDGSELAGALGKAWPLSLALFTTATTVAIAGLGV